MKYFIFSRLSRMFAAISRVTGRISESFAICRDCGRNPYTGEPCKHL